MAWLAGPSRAGEDVVFLNCPGCRVAVQYVARIDAILCTQCRPDGVQPPSDSSNARWSIDALTPRADVEPIVSTSIASAA